MKSKRPLCLIIFFIVFFIILCVIAFCINLAYQGISNIEISILTALSFLPTVAIAVIAYTQLTKLVDTNLDEALLALDKQWRTREIIKARMIVDKYFQEKYRINPETKNNYKAAIAKVSDDIFKLSRPESKKELKKGNSEFIYVLSLIELLETIGFLYAEGNDEIKSQIKKLFKDSVTFYYPACEKYIINAMGKPDRPKRFKYFTDVYNEFQCDR